MLKRLVMTFAVVATLAALAVPLASAGAAAASPAKVAASTAAPCPFGTDNGNYCEHLCIVPRLYGNSLLVAIIKITLAGCRLGQINILPSGAVAAPALTDKNRNLFTVVAQEPLPGSFRPFQWPVKVWVMFGP